MNRLHRSVVIALLAIIGAASASIVSAQNSPIALKGVIQFRGAIVASTQPRNEATLSQSLARLKPNQRTLHMLGRTIHVRKMSELSASDLDIPVLAFHSRNLAEQQMDPQKAIYAVVDYQ